MDEYKATIVKEHIAVNEDIEITESLRDSLQGRHIYENVVKDEIVGIVDSAEIVEGVGVIIEASIFDEEIKEKMDEGKLKPCPSLIVDTAGEMETRAYNVFMSDQPGSIVGPCEKINS